MNYHIGRIVLGSMCVGVSVWFGWSGIRVAGFSLQHGYHSNQLDKLDDKSDIIHLTIGTRKNIFIFQPNGEMFQHRMLLCISTVHDDGQYYRPKLVVEVIVYMLTNRYAIIWT